ncbi:MAG: protein kinase [Chloroflexi bacterium]|nr:protein kinase [Chloroflexota bacterium]
MQGDEFIGKVVRDFVVQERIGRGGMATVYRAFQPVVNRDVALKVMRLDKEGEIEDFRRRFAHEAKLIAALEHIHILPIYDYGLYNANAYIAMRLLRGGTLTDLLRDGPLPINRAADLFTQVARGLAYAHSKGVIHRDLKPSNILLDDAGNAYLTDFGLAKLIESESQITKSGNVVGTPAYMAPEQLRGDPLDHRSDIYSLGIILYQMVTGRPPFEAPSGEVISIIYKHLEETPKPPSEINPDVPPQIEEIILKALQKKPEDRYQSVNDMIDTLNLALGRLSTIEQTTARQLQNALRKREQRQRKMLTRAGIVVGLVALLALIGGIFLLTSGALQMQAATHTAAAIEALRPNVLEGEQGQVEDNVPNQAEVTLARERLGESFIAYITCTLDTAYHAGQMREVTSFLTEYGLNYQVYDGDTDSYLQVTLVDQAIADGASAIILCPLDTTLLADSLATVEQRGIPLVQFIGAQPSYGGVLLAGDDYVMGVRAGRLAGQIIAAEMNGQANVIILDYPDLPQIVQRANGLQDGLLSYAPDANIIGRYIGATPELGRASVSALITDGVEFDVILSINDAGAFGATEAMSAAGIDPADVIIVSVDAEPRAQEYMRAGFYFRGSVEVNRTEFSHAAVYAVVKLLTGNPIPETLLVPPGEVITRDSLANADATATAQSAAPAATPNSTADASATPNP